MFGARRSVRRSVRRVGARRTVRRGSGKYGKHGNMVTIPYT